VYSVQLSLNKNFGYIFWLLLRRTVWHEHQPRSIVSITSASADLSSVDNSNQITMLAVTVKL